MIPISTYAQEYDITNYYVDIKVNENNSYDINEYYNLAFEEKDQFQRTISLNNKVYLSNNKFISYVSEIKDIKTEEEISIETKKKEYIITFLESAEYTSKNITIGYNYNMGNDLDAEYDIVYANVVNNLSALKEDTVSFSITLPCDAEDQNIKFYYNNKEIKKEDAVEYTLDGNYIEGSIKYAFATDDIFSIQVILPEGTFKNEVRTDNITNYFLIIIPIGLIILAIFSYRKYKRQKGSIKTQNMDIMKSFDSVETAFLYNGKISAMDLLTSLFTLANDGYISFKNIGSKNNVKFKIKKEKEYDKENAAQKILFDGLFQNRDEVEIHDIEGVFYPYYVDITKIFSNKDNREKLIYKGANKIKHLILIGSFLGMIPLQISALYSILNSYVFAIIGAICISLLLTMAYLPKNKLLKMIMIGISLALIIIEAYSLIDFRLNLIMYCVGMISLEITLFLESLIPTRTIYGNQVKHDIESFKLELTAMTVEEFTEKQKENPNYFFTMLPYLFIFNLNSWWFNRFGDMLTNPPAWYESSESYTVQKFEEFVVEVINSLALPIQTNRMYADELLHQAPNKLL